VPFGEERLLEAHKHGFKRALVPAANVPRKKIALDITPVERLSQALT
jgi:DNA repair protein RadA/Sms